MTVVEQEFVAREPDCGTVFVWVGRAFGPRAGWIASWALLAATFLALANLANVAGTYAFLFVGADGAAGTEWATIVVGLGFLALAVWLAVRGIHVSARVQAWMLGAGMAVLVVFAVVALVKIVAGTAGAQAPTPALSWFNPFAVDGTSALSAGLLLGILFYWGWDGSAAVVEEAEGGRRGARCCGRRSCCSASTSCSASRSRATRAWATRASGWSARRRPATRCRWSAAPRGAGGSRR